MPATDGSRPKSAAMPESAPADDAPDTLILADCRLLNVHSGEIVRTDVTIAGNRIRSIDPGAGREGTEVVDCAGRYVVPGLIDAHMHVDTTFLWPGELARAIVPLGTTSLFVDTTNGAHSGGTPAIEALRDAFAGLPLRGFVGAPSYCPFNAALGTAATEMDAREIAALGAAGYASIGETVWSRMRHEDRDYIRGVQSFREAGLRVSGHGGEIRSPSAAEFDAYVCAGIQDDHCIGRAADILPRAERALRQFFVECTGRRGQLRPLLDEAIRQSLPLRQVCLSIDNNTSMDIVTNGFGYMDYLVRIAMEAGIPPVDAYRMATLNSAEHHRVSRDIGSVAPGRLADVLVLDAFDRFPPRLVIVDGRVVARDGALVVPIPAPHFPPSTLRSIAVSDGDASALAVPSARPDFETVRVIESIDGDAFNKELIRALPVRDGAIQPLIEDDILKIVVIERYGRGGRKGIGFVRGFGLGRGAIATSVSVPFNHIVAVGVSDADIWDAVRALRDIQGGFVVVDGGTTLAEVPLRVSGIMSDQPFETFLAAVQIAEAAARELGCGLDNPFKTLVSTVHTTLPDLGLTDLGLIDTRRGEAVSLIVDPAPELRAG